MRDGRAKSRPLAFYARGLRACSASIDEPFATLGFEFLSAETVIKHTKMLRNAADENAEDDDEEDEHAEVIRHGVALTLEEPELVLSDGVIYHFSFRNPVLRVASSSSEFLEHYLAAGCFHSHSFKTLWNIVGPLVPTDIPVDKNVWVSAYLNQFDE